MPGTGGRNQYIFSIISQGVSTKMPSSQESSRAHSGRVVGYV